MKKLFTFLAITLFLVSCSSDDDNTDNTDYYKVVAGHWVSYKEDCSTCLYEEFTFRYDQTNGSNVLYKEYYTGNNTLFSVSFTIDKNNIYTKDNGTYSYVKDGNSLTLTKDGVKHELTKK